MRVEVGPAGPGLVDLVATAGPLRATTVAAAEIPSLDEVPILAVAAAAAEGTSVFHDMGELRVKESDRLAATAELVRRPRGRGRGGRRRPGRPRRRP